VAQDEVKERQILDGAQRVFALYGFRKTTIGDVVREAGVARATVYKYFPAKEDLFRAVIEREMVEMLAEDRRAVGRETTLRGKLMAFVLTHAAMVRKKMNLSRMSMGELADLYPRRHWEETKLVVEAEALLRGILEEGVKTGEIAPRDPDPRPFAILMVFKSLFLGAATQQLGEEETRGLADVLVGLVVDGLRAREEAA
jgi:TetR/AcrR family transcriptional regulator